MAYTGLFVLSALVSSMLMVRLAGPERNLVHPYILLAFVAFLGGALASLSLYILRKRSELDRAYGNWREMEVFYNCFSRQEVLQEEVDQQLGLKAQSYQDAVDTLERFRQGGLAALGRTKDDFDRVKAQLVDEEATAYRSFLNFKNLASTFPRLVQVKDGDYRAYLPRGKKSA